MGFFKFEIIINHCKYKLLQLHLWTVISTLESLETLESDVHRGQILTSKVDPRTVVPESKTVYWVIKPSNASLYYIKKLFLILMYLYYGANKSCHSILHIH